MNACFIGWTVQSGDLACGTNAQYLEFACHNNSTGASCSTSLSYTYTATLPATVKLTWGSSSTDCEISVGVNKGIVLLTYAYVTEQTDLSFQLGTGDALRISGVGLSCTVRLYSVEIRTFGSLLLCP